MVRWVTVSGGKEHLQGEAVVHRLVGRVVHLPGVEEERRPVAGDALLYSCPGCQSQTTERW